MEKIKLAIIFGGKLSEYPVSLHSTRSLIHKINKEHYGLIFIGISKDRKWYAYDGDVDGIEHDTWLCEGHYTPCVLSSNEGCRDFLKLHTGGVFIRIEVDYIFSILHGKSGEGGATQDLFGLGGTLYAGCGYMSSATCMDKEVAYIAVKYAGISCAPFVCVYEVDDLGYRKVYEYAKGTLGPPIFVKPASAGSSLGIYRMESFNDFEEAMKNAFYHDGKDKVILETTIRSSKIGVAVMEDKEFFMGNVDETETTAPFFDYEGKHEMVDSHIYYPARISPKLFEEAKEIVKKAYRTMNYKGMTRVDMFVTPRDTTILNEVSTALSSTNISHCPTMVKEVGIPFPELIDRLVVSTMEE